MGRMNNLGDVGGAASLSAKDPVLVVDDEKPLLEIYSAALGPHFEVTTATSSREAEAILRKKKFKVVISDHLMPGGNGMSFLVRAREEYPETQRILVTAYMKPEMLLRSVNEASLFRYLIKPARTMIPDSSQSGTDERRPVLVIDDEVQFLQTVRTGLGSEFEIDTATSAAEAEMLMAVRPYSVVICDHLMPGEAGLDFLVRMREMHPDTKRILITGYLNPELLSRSISLADLAACLIKPVSNAELGRAVRDALAG